MDIKRLLAKQEYLLASDDRTRLNLSLEETDNNAEESERSVSNAWSHHNPTFPGCFLHSSPSF